MNILFVAKYAPNSIKEKIPTNTTDGIYAEYHYDIYKILANEFGNVASTNNPDYIIYNKENIDYVFSLLNRMPFRNSEIFISAMLEYYKIAYLGATPNIRAIAEDKHIAKVVAEHHRILTPPWCIFQVGDEPNKPEFNEPYFVKPRFGASSNKITESCICDDWNSAKLIISELYSEGVDVIVEKFIDGIIYTCPIISNFGKTVFLPPIKETSQLRGNLVTFEHKRKIIDGMKRDIIDNDILKIQLKALCQQIYNNIQPLDYTRFDFIVEKETGIPYFIEFNVCCNLGRKSAFSMSAKSVGLNYKDLILNIVYSSLYRNKLVGDVIREKFQWI